MYRFLKRALFTCILTTVLFGFYTAEVNAQVDQHDDVGLGIILGEPSGISYKNYFNSQNAVDAALGWSAYQQDGIYFHADYLWHHYDLFQDMDDATVEQGLVGLYFGIGGRIFLGETSDLGVRVPVGVNYMFETAPVEIFLEVVPTLDLVPNTEGDFDAGIGVRYYF